MIVVRGFRRLGLRLRRPAVTIGNFDGVHVGHQKVMRAACEEAARRGVRSVVCTFDPHTAHVLRPTQAPPLLQTLEQRLAAIDRLGVDVVVVIPFDRQIAAVGRRRFVDEFLVGEVSAGSLHVSKGFSFGRERAGRTRYLEERAPECGFTVERVAAVIADGEPVSSTRVRFLVAAGEVGAARRLLTRPYAVTGRVVQGAGRGGRLGAPTANLDVDNGCLPGEGVYTAVARVRGGCYAAVANVGRRPTFGEGGPVVVEAHLLAGRHALYGARMQLDLLERLRGERRFADERQLRAQIAEDIARARRYFGAA